MSATTFLYTLKVWLSAVFVAPLLFITGISVKEVFFDMDTTSQITGQMLAGDWKVYKSIVLLGAVFSFPTWLIFLMAIMIARKSSDSARQRRQIVVVVAITLTIGTFAAVLGIFGIFFDLSFIYIPLSYCISIAVGGWYYKLEATEKPEPETLINLQ